MPVSKSPMRSSTRSKPYGERPTQPKGVSSTVNNVPVPVKSSKPASLKETTVTSNKDGLCKPLSPTHNKSSPVSSSSKPSPQAEAMKKKVLHELLTKTPPKPAFSSASNSKLHVTATACSSSANACLSNNKPTLSSPTNSKLHVNGLACSPPSNAQTCLPNYKVSPTSPTSPATRILGKSPISKTPHKHVINEIKRLGHHTANGCNPQPVVIAARVQSTPAKKNVVEEIQQMGQNGLVNILQSTAPNRTTNLPKTASGMTTSIKQAKK